MSQKTNIFKKCLFCDKTFKIYPYEIDRAKFCSRICQTTYISRNKPPRKNLKVVTDSGGYIREWNPGNPSSYKTGYILQHRAVVERSLGRTLRRDEHIHHINGDKSDNRIENLQIISQSEHQTLHNRERPTISDETRTKMRLAKLGKPGKSSTKFVRGMIPWNKGLTYKLSH